LYEIRNQLFHFARQQKHSEPLQVHRTDLWQGMLAVEMLHDEEQIEWKDQFLFAQTAGVPEYDQLIFTLLNG
jgi:hypothetical protein